MTALERVRTKLEALHEQFLEVAEKRERRMTPGQRQGASKARHYRLVKARKLGLGGDAYLLPLGGNPDG